MVWLVRVSKEDVGAELWWLHWWIGMNVKSKISLHHGGRNGSTTKTTTIMISNLITDGHYSNSTSVRSVIQFKPDHCQPSDVPISIPFVHLKRSQLHWYTNINLWPNLILRRITIWHSLIVAGLLVENAGLKAIHRFSSEFFSHHTPQLFATIYPQIM